jgi:glutamyl-Q tRNA(Asp) synthetase
MSLKAPPHTTRFAPSPTGYLHLGHAYAAWFARQAGSVFRLRLEDIDPDRCRPEYADAIVEDLSWLGLTWQGDILVQSARMKRYEAALDRLREAGLLYPCFCSRADIRRESAAAVSAPHGPDGAPLYPGTCRHLSPGFRARRLTSGAPHAWRLNMQAALAAGPPKSFTENGATVPCDPAAFGDVILGRRDGAASYHLCVTHDDAAQGITLVTRGQDLRPATHLQVLLQHLLGWPTPSYCHHTLLRGADGKRLAKREGAESLRAMRAAGLAPEAVLRMAVLQAGQPDTAL